jgi:hypothetical protein
LAKLHIYSSVKGAGFLINKGTPMKTILSSLMALAFLLSTAPSHAFTSHGSIAVDQFKGPSGVTAYSLVGRCKMTSKAASQCRYINKLENGANHNSNAQRHAVLKKRGIDCSYPKYAQQPTCKNAFGEFRKKSAEIYSRYKACMDAC